MNNDNTNQQHYTTLYYIVYNLDCLGENEAVQIYRKMKNFVLPH